MSDHHDIHHHEVHHDAALHHSQSSHHAPPDQSQHQREDLTHGQTHGHHHHDHHHGHAHGGHGHGHGHGEHGHHPNPDGSGDQWSGEDYLKMPGVRETAVKTHESIVHALTSAGMTKAELKSLDLLEVGCGAGAVTQHLVGTFGTVHSIDPSPSMLLAFSSHLPPQSDNLTWGIHIIHPNSAEDLAEGKLMVSPIPSDPSRKIKPPRTSFDVAVVNLVLHHIDDTSSFLRGLVGLLKPGGWVIVTEFAVEGGDEDLTLEDDLHKEIKAGKADEHGSVNRPGHFHAAFNVKSITELLSSHGLIDVHAEIRGRLPVFDDPSKYPLNLVARGRKA